MPLFPGACAEERVPAGSAAPERGVAARCLKESLAALGWWGLSVPLAERVGEPACAPPELDLFLLSTGRCRIPGHEQPAQVQQHHPGEPAGEQLAQVQLQPQAVSICPVGGTGGHPTHVSNLPVWEQEPF